MDWNLEKTKLLIESVQQHPFLYNGTLSPRQLVLDTWCKIAKTIGSTGSDCTRRWQFLRNEYSQHKRIEPAGIEPCLKFLDAFLETPRLNPSRRVDSFEYCTKLAQLVQEYPQLYAKCKQSAVGSDAWQDVAKRMGTGDSAAQCQYRWNRLLNRYQQHLKQNCGMKPVGIEHHLEFITPPKESIIFTVKLVNLVREVPVLYESTNRRHPAWRSVAKQMENGVTADECERIWRRLRGAYRNYLQKGWIMRPFGIVNHMEFLKAYEKAEEYGAKKMRLEKQQLHEKQRRDSAVAAVQRVNQIRFDEEDEDLLFLFEFLPDMARMDEKQKRYFKLEAMRLTEKVRESLQ